jgi:hypothetical protein
VNGEGYAFFFRHATADWRRWFDTFFFYEFEGQIVVLWIIALKLLCTLGFDMLMTQKVVNSTYSH